MESDMALRKVNSRLDFVLQVTNYFNGHWESPDWGTLPSNQVLIALAIRDLAGGIRDAALQKAIVEAADRAVAKNAVAMK